MTNVKNCKIYWTTLDPVYIGTWGYNIGRVDNTIVKDTITWVPKIPWSSLGWNWRYYMALTLQDKISWLQPKFSDISNWDWSLEKKLKEFKSGANWNNLEDWQKYYWNLINKLQCAGQDDLPQNELDNPFERDNNWNTDGHCWHCIVCKTFGYSKKNHSQQGRALFSDLNILFFPVYTYLGVKWITCERVINDAWINIWDKIEPIETEKVMLNKEEEENQNYINLGYLNLPIQKDKIQLNLSWIDTELKKDIENNLIIVPNNLFSQIVNANLEVRTSNSIDPITWAAKDKALFTSEAIPRLTVLYGNIRIQDTFDKDSELNEEKIRDALNDTKDLFKVLGIWWMNTRGFGRIKVEWNFDETKKLSQENSDDSK